MNDKLSHRAKRKVLRRPSALKHGAFSRSELMPWESAAEFDRLCLSLVDQYRPKGVLQEDCLRSLASYLWRKRRVQDKRRFDLALTLEKTENNVLWEDPPPLLENRLEAAKYALANMRRGPRKGILDDYQQLLGFSASLYQSLDGTHVKIRITMLPSEYSAHLREKIPSSNYECTENWIVALKKEVDQVLLPMVRNRYPKADHYY
jgi:hypothetical protein